MFVLSSIGEHRETTPDLSDITETAYEKFCSGEISREEFVAVNEMLFYLNLLSLNAEPLTTNSSTIGGQDGRFQKDSGHVSTER